VIPYRAMVGAVGGGGTSAGGRRCEEKISSVLGLQNTQSRSQPIW
jgi:hypothetical protein